MAVPLHVNALITVTGLFRREDHRNPGRNLHPALRDLQFRQSGRNLINPLRVEDPSNPIYDIARTAYPNANFVSLYIIVSNAVGEAEYNPADEQFTYKIGLDIAVSYSQIVDKQELVNALNAGADRINDLLEQRPEFTGEEQGAAARYYHGITNKTFTVSEEQAGGRKRKIRRSRKVRKIRKAHKGSKRRSS
jgi:hypothetical protein